MNGRCARRATVVIAVAAPLLLACGNDGPAVDRQAVLDGLVADVYVPGYEQVVVTAEELTASLDELCSATDPGTALAAARDDWSSLRTAWLRTRSFRFGPAIDQRAMSDIDFPVDSVKVDAYLAGDEPVDEVGVGSLGADVRGMNAIEHVLFGDDPTGDRPCAYMVSAAGLVLARAERVLDGWNKPDGDTPSFAAQISDPGSDGSMYDDVADVYNDIVNHMIFALGDVGERRLGRASGDVTGTPSPTDVDAGAAQRALLDSADMLASVIAVYEGGRGDDGADAAGLRAVVASMSKDAADALDEQFAAAAATIDAIPDPLAENTDPAPVHDAYEAVQAAQVTLLTEVASLLGVTLTFGDADGDS